MANCEGSPFFWWITFHLGDVQDMAPNRTQARWGEGTDALPMCWELMNINMNIRRLFHGMCWDIKWVYKMGTMVVCGKNGHPIIITRWAQ